MTVISFVTFFDGATYVHTGKKGKNKGLYERYHDFNKIHEQGKSRNDWGDSQALENENKTEQTQQDNVTRCDISKKPNH